MQVTVYAAGELGAGRPLHSLPSVPVEVLPGWWVADVLEHGGHDGYNSFALVTPAVEADVAAGEQHIIAAAYNLLGVDEQGLVSFQGEDHVAWADFARAVEAGLYSGDPNRIVVYPGGAAGGLSPDGLWEAVQWLFDNRSVAITALEDLAKVGGGFATIVGGTRWISGVRRRQIARQWRSQGFTAPRIREYLGRCPQWDSTQLATQMQLSELEAGLALSNAGYQRGDDGLWRPSASPEVLQRREGLERIEARAWENIEDGWSDDFLDEQDDSEDDAPRT